MKRYLLLSAALLMTSGTIQAASNVIRQGFNNYTAPPDCGTNGQSLTSNGNCGTTWTTASGGSFVTATSSVTLPYGINVSSGIYLNATTITSTSTITSTMSFIVASCTTQGASPTAWITLTLPPASLTNGSSNITIYDVGTDSCSIKIAGNGTDVIESTGVIRLDAKSQHAVLQVIGSGLWGGSIQYTPWSVFTTQDDVGSFSVATSSLVYSCPVYIPVPVGVMGFRLNRTSNTGLMSTALTDMNGKYVIGVSSQATINGVQNYTTGSVTSISPGWYRWEFTANNTAVAITGSNSAVSNKIYCSTVGTDTFGIDLSKFVPTLPGTADSNTYPAVDLLINGGLQGF